ncbi:uncharacterized protein LOC143861566 [Tasmannia lanceolata]|uniref:uncharacterized protein LOC143861566 n=1 Tax=Tasmannia lanceolata TaxID=3420 RepID=UPI0040644226
MRVSEFYNTIRKIEEKNKAVYEWLMKIPKEHWAFLNTLLAYKQNSDDNFDIKALLLARHQKLYFNPATVKMLSNLKVLLRSLPEGTIALGLPVATGAYIYTMVFVTVLSLASVFNEYALKSQFETSIYLQNLFFSVPRPALREPPSVRQIDGEWWFTAAKTFGDIKAYMDRSFTKLEMCFSTTTQNNPETHSKLTTQLMSQVRSSTYFPILPGLPDDVAKYCLAPIPRCHFPVRGAVCKRWRSFIQSKEFITVRKEAGRLEDWLYVLTGDADGKGSHWEILDCLGVEPQLLPPMPGLVKASFGVVVLDGKLLVMGGYLVDAGNGSVSADVYQYDSRLNRWSMLAKMNVARYDFACVEVGGVVYAVGGFGADGESLSSAEMYDPDTNKWTPIELQLLFPSSTSISLAIQRIGFF